MLVQSDPFKRRRLYIRSPLCHMILALYRSDDTGGYCIFVLVTNLMSSLGLIKLDRTFLVL